MKGQLATALLVAAATMACSDASTGPAELGVDLRRDRSSTSSSDATVYVVHGINGTDLGLADAALPVDVCVNGGPALEGFRFREIEGPLTLPAGSYDIQVRLASSPACEGAVAIDAPGLSLTGGSNVSIVAHLAEGGVPTASVFANNVQRTGGRARVAAHHTADFGAVDVLVDGGVAFAGVLNGQQGVAMVRPGMHEIAIAIAGTDTRAFETRLVLRPFSLYNAYAAGTPANGTFEVLLQRIRVERRRWDHRDDDEDWRERDDEEDDDDEGEPDGDD